ncbi:hypothetical protein ALT721_1570034 [Alteromonas alvinellae]
MSVGVRFNEPIKNGRELNGRFIQIVTALSFGDCAVNRLFDTLFVLYQQN